MSETTVHAKTCWIASLQVPYTKGKKTFRTAKLFYVSQVCVGTSCDHENSRKSHVAWIAAWCFWLSWNWENLAFFLSSVALIVIRERHWWQVAANYVHILGLYYNLASIVHVGWYWMPPFYNTLKRVWQTSMYTVSGQ